MRIKAWSITVVWEDGSEEQISDIPDFAAREVDTFLDELEQERNEDLAQDNDVWQAYDGVCPDCGTDIPTDVVEGQQCAECGFNFKKEIE